jgi:hypothetical protein
VRHDEIYPQFLSCYLHTVEGDRTEAYDCFRMPSIADSRFAVPIYREHP